MNRREPDLFRVALRSLVVLGLDIGEQGQLGQEILDRIELVGEHGELFEIFQPVAIVGEVFLEIIVVARVNHQPQHLRRAFADGLVFELGNGGDELRPGRRRLGRNGFGAGLKGSGQSLQRAGVMEALAAFPRSAVDGFRLPV